MILVVDDEVDFRATLEWTLNRKNFEVLVAGNTAHAQELFSVRHIDAIVTDINMPDMSGLEFLRWVKLQPKVVPVILMSGLLDRGDLKAAHELGAAGVLAKPFHREELLEALSHCLKRTPAAVSG